MYTQHLAEGPKPSAYKELSNQLKMNPVIGFTEAKEHQAAKLLRKAKVVNVFHVSHTQQHVKGPRIGKKAVCVVIHNHGERFTPSVCKRICQGSWQNMHRFQRASTLLWDIAYKLGWKNASGGVRSIGVGLYP